MDAEMLSALGTAGSTGISLIALGISVVAWRAARRSAMASERVSDIESIRLHSELQPQWECSFEEKTSEGPILWLKLVGPSTLTLPCEAEAGIRWNTLLGTWDAQKEVVKTVTARAQLAWQNADHSNTADPPPAYRLKGIRVGERRAVRFRPLPEKRGLHSAGYRGTLHIVLLTRLRDHEPWCTTMQLRFGAADK